MEAYRSLIIVGCVAAYMVLCIGVGLWALKLTKSTKDFFMAGRNLGILVTAVAVFSSTMSGFGFVGGPGLVYRMGTSSFWIVIATSISYCLAFYLLGKRIRLFAELRESVSLPDAVAARYGSNTTAALTAVAILLGVMGYLATQILAMAITLQSVLAGVEWIGTIRLEFCVAISCAVLVFYCVTGGIIASVYTDLVQGLLMMLAAVLVFLTAAAAVDGGVMAMSQTMLRDDPESIGPWGSRGIFCCLSWYFLFGLGLVGQPHVITKMMMSRRVSDARQMLPLSVFGYGVTALLWIGIGLAMRTLVLQGDHTALMKPDDAAPEFLQSYAHPLLAGLVFAGLFAAIMSTADSFLNIGAAAVVHDIPRAVRGRSLDNELFWARTGTGVIAIVASGFALWAYYVSKDLVALLGAFGWGTFAAALVPTVAIGFNWKRATPLAANVAIVTSLVFNFSIKLFGITIPYAINEGAIALLISLTLFFGISLLSPPPKIDPDIDEVMDI